MALGKKVTPLVLSGKQRKVRVGLAKEASSGENCISSSHG